MKKHYYFFMILFLFLTRIVNAQDPNRISHVWTLDYPGQILGIENMDNDTDKELVMLYINPSNTTEGPAVVIVYNPLTGEKEWQSPELKMAITATTASPHELAYLGLVKVESTYAPSLVDFNNDGIYEILIKCGCRGCDYPMPDWYMWRLFAFGGAVKPVKPVVK